MIVYQMILNIAACTTVGPCCLSILYIGIQVCISYIQTHNPTLLHCTSATISLFSMFLILFLFPRGVRCVIFLIPHVSDLVFCCSIAQLCPTLCNPVDCSTPGSLSFTVQQSLLKLMSTESMMHTAISSSVAPFSSCPQSFPASGSFPKS